MILQWRMKQSLPPSFQHSHTVHFPLLPILLCPHNNILINEVIQIRCFPGCRDAKINILHLCHDMTFGQFLILKLP